MHASLRFGIAASAVTALLMVGGCNRGDKGQGALKSGQVADLNLSRANADVFAPYFAVGDCEVEEMEALGVMAGLGMGESGDGGMSFESRAFADGVVTYSEIKLVNPDDDNQTFTAEAAAFYCPQMSDDGETFARLDMTDVVIADTEARFEFETLNIASPSPYAAQSLIRGITQPDEDVRISGAVEFGAMSATEIKVSGDGFTGNIETLAWGMDDTTELMNILLDDMSMDFDIGNRQAGEKSPMKIEFEGLSARNLSMGQAGNIGGIGMMGQAMSQVTLLDKPYDEFVIDTLSINSDMFTMDFDGMEARASQSGDVITILQNLKPMEIRFDDSMADHGEFGAIYSQIKTLGFEKLKMFGNSKTVLDKGADTVSVTDGLLVVEEALRLNYEYKAEGVQAVADATAAQQEKYEADIKAAMENIETDPSVNFPSPPDPMAAIAPLKLHNFRMTVEDNSAVERGLRLASEMTGQSEATLKRSLGLAVVAAAFAGENDVQSEVYSEVASAFADFVKKGGTLTIEANPAEPFAIAPLVTSAGDGIDPKSLGFSATQSN